MSAKIWRFERDIDADGRMLLPTELLDEYSEVVLTLGFGDYLHLTNNKVWYEFEQSLAGDILSEELADLADRLIYGIYEQQIDEFGRITIPPVLRDLAQITDRVIGVRNRPGYFRLYAESVHQARTQARLTPAPEYLQS